MRSPPFRLAIRTTGTPERGMLFSLEKTPFSSTRNLVLRGMGEYRGPPPMSSSAPLWGTTCMPPLSGAFMILPFRSHRHTTPGLRMTALPPHSVLYPSGAAMTAEVLLFQSERKESWTRSFSWFSSRTELLVRPGCPRQDLPEPHGAGAPPRGRGPLPPCAPWGCG